LKIIEIDFYYIYALFSLFPSYALFLLFGHPKRHPSGVVAVVPSVCTKYMGYTHQSNERKSRTKNFHIKIEYKIKLLNFCVVTMPTTTTTTTTATASEVKSERKGKKTPYKLLAVACLWKLKNIKNVCL
jgi:hypothetical protein